MRQRFGHSVFSDSNLFRISDFEFRICRPGQPQCAAECIAHLPTAKRCCGSVAATLILLRPRSCGSGICSKTTSDGTPSSSDRSCRPRRTRTLPRSPGTWPGRRAWSASDRWPGWPARWPSGPPRRRSRPGRGGRRRQRRGYLPPGRPAGGRIAGHRHVQAGRPARLPRRARGHPPFDLLVLRKDGAFDEPGPVRPGHRRRQGRRPGRCGRHQAANLVRTPETSTGPGADQGHSGRLGVLIVRTTASAGRPPAPTGQDPE